MTAFRAAALACWAAAAIGTSAAELTSEQWRADVAFLAKELPQRHKDAFHTLSRAQFDRMVSDLDAAIPKLSEVEIRGRIAQLVASIGDGHTLVEIASDGWFDLSFEHFPEGLFVISAVKDYEQAIGARVIAIEGTPAAEVQKRLLPYQPAENRYAAVAYAGLVHNPAVLRAAGITRSIESAEFLLEKDGRRFPLTVKARPAKEKSPPRAPLPYTQPVSLKGGNRNYRFEYLPDSGTLYIEYKLCRQMPDLPFRTFAAQVLESARKESPRKIVIDLRQNPGGDSEVINPLLDALRTTPALQPPGGLYVLSGPGTYSSGLIAAILLRDQFQGFFVGEPGMERLNNYGDIRVFRLPNSKITVQYAGKFFAMAEGDPESFEPEITVPLTAADYFAGRDAAWEAVMKMAPSADTNFRAVMARDPHRTTAYLSLAGIALRQNRSADAEAILRQGLAANPHAADLRVALSAHFRDVKKFGDARASLAADPDTPGALYELGRINLAEGKFDAAAAAFRHCYAADPRNVRGLSGVADVYMTQHKPEEALLVLDEEAVKAPRNVEIPLLAARVAAQFGKIDTQIAEYRRIIAQLGDRSPDAVEIWAQLSEAYRYKHDQEQALRAFQSLLEGTKEMPMLLEPLQGHYENAMRAQPDDRLLAYEVGLIYLEKKNWPSALTLFRGLIAKMPDQPLPHYQLALALRGSGDAESARAELREALRLKPPVEIVAAIQALLK